VEILLQEEKGTFEKGDLRTMNTKILKRTKLPPMTKWIVVYGCPKPRIREIWVPSDRTLVLPSEGIMHVSIENYPKEEEK